MDRSITIFFMVPILKKLTSIKYRVNINAHRKLLVTVLCKNNITKAMPVSCSALTL
jgi:hypothetical protein